MVNLYISSDINFAQLKVHVKMNCLNCFVELSKEMFKVNVLVRNAVGVFFCGSAAFIIMPYARSTIEELL